MNRSSAVKHMNHRHNNTSLMRRAAMAFPAQQSRAESEQWCHLTGKRLAGNRRIEALARRFNCLGYFSEQPGPRAA